MQSSLISKQTIIDELEKHRYECEEYGVGIKVYMNHEKYIDISRCGGEELQLDVYTLGKLDPLSLAILEDRGRIRFASLIKILDSIRHKF